MHGSSSISSSREPIRGGCGWWCCFLLSLLPTPEPQNRWIEVPPLDGLCLAETSHDGCWSCYKMSGHSARKERTEEQTNEPRDDIFSQRDVLLGCYHCHRRCVLVDHENCRCPKIFLLLLLLLLRPPKLHVQWPSTFSIIQAVYLAVKSSSSRFESISKGRLSHCEHYYGEDTPYPPSPMGDGGNGVRYLNKRGRGQP